MPNNQKIKPQPASDKDISLQLERMLSSPDFHATPQQIALLKFVVNQTLAGNAHEIKGYTVATRVFGRGPDFDQSIDPVVSIQASRLRRAMERYYLTVGESDPIRIDIPKGTYVPTFRGQLPNHQPIGIEPAASVSVMQTWPTVLVRPLENLTNQPEDNYLSIGLTAELAHALSHYKEIRVLEAIQRDAETRPPESDIDFVIDGSVRRDPMSIRVAIRLCDARRCIQLWSGKYQGDFEAAGMISFQEDVASEVAVRVAGDNAAITRHMAEISKSKTTPDPTTYEAMLRFWESDTRLTPNTMARAIQALKHATTRQPEYGQTWSMLAAQYADNYGLEIVDIPTPLEKAVEYARKGVSLDPTNRRARMILGYVLFMQNKIQEARYETEKAYNLCPNSIMVLDGMGWLMALAGGWERGVNWINKAIKLNPYYRPWARHPLFLNWFRQGNYEKAYQEILHFTMPDFFWEWIFKAANYSRLGRMEEGRACVRTLLKLKPDFNRRGRILMEKYMKFEDIVEDLIEGLRKLGLETET